MAQFGKFTSYSWRVKYTPGNTYSTEHDSVDIVEANAITKGGPNAGYPVMLGKSQMTSALDGSTQSVVAGNVSATTTHQYHNPPIMFETHLSGTYPVTGALVASPPPVASTFDAQLNAKLFKKVSDAINEFQGGVFIGEIRETLQLLKNPAGSLVKNATKFVEVQRRYRARAEQLLRNKEEALTAMREVRASSKAIKSRARGYDRKIRLLHKTWSAEWLKFQYGVKPLLADCEDAVKRLNRITANKSKTVVRAGLSAAFEPVIHQPASQQAAAWSWTQMGADYGFYDGHAQALVTVLSSPTHFDLSNWGISWGNLAPTLWELTWASFIIDYVFNIGEILTMTFAETGNVVWSWAGCEINMFRYMVATQAVCTLDGTPNFGASPWSSTNRIVRRWIPTTDEAILAFRVELPGLRQGINLFALTQATRKW